MIEAIMLRGQLIGPPNTLQFGVATQSAKWKGF